MSLTRQRHFNSDDEDDDEELDDNAEEEDEVNDNKEQQQRPDVDNGKELITKKDSFERNEVKWDDQDDKKNREDNEG